MCLRFIATIATTGIMMYLFLCLLDIMSSAIFHVCSLVMNMMRVSILFIQDNLSALSPPKCL